MRGKSGIRGQREEEKREGVEGLVLREGVSSGITLACVQFSVNAEIFWSWSCCCVSGRFNFTVEDMLSVCVIKNWTFL